MSKAHKCDRCGTFFEKSPSLIDINLEKIKRIKVLAYDKDEYYLGDVDLCDCCREHLILWFKNEEVVNRSEKENQ